MGAKAKPSDDLIIGGSLMHAAEPDFSGYATKAGLKCSDGRTIMPDAFKHQDKMTVPLVWHHNHDTPGNVLGHAILENRKDGVYCYGFFNETDEGQKSKTLVKHGDIKSLSIFANKLTEKAKQVVHGFIREVSLVMAGANPGALIDYITVEHGDGDVTVIDDEAVIFTGLEFGHEEDDDDDDVEHSADDPTMQEIYDELDEDQKKLVNFMVGAALEDKQSVKQSATDDDEDEEESDLSHDEKEKGKRHMKRNVFEQQKDEGGEKEQHVLSHDDLRDIQADAVKTGSLKMAMENYVVKHGIENIDILFPEAKNVSNTPEFDKRRTEWVASVISGVKKAPWSRIKSLTADLTQDEARARGYIKGTMKKEEFFGLAKRTTTPTTIYKKQQLDRDDIIDITDMDVVVWLKGEMRLMLDEEWARAILIGDGREVDDEDKIKDPAAANDGAGIRSIANEHELYAATVTVNMDDAGSTPQEVVDEIIRSMRFYKGSGSPTLYTTLPTLTYMLLARDGVGRRLYRTASDLAAELGVAGIVTVEVMEGEDDLFGIIVNLSDYTVGTDRGGEINFFDDFDIDYNQYKYLIETRLSGALTKIRSAIIVRKAAADAVEVAPPSPDFDGTEVTINDTAGVVYRRADTNAVVNTAGSPYAVAAGETLGIYAEPAAGYYFESNQDDQWEFTNQP